MGERMIPVELDTGVPLAIEPSPDLAPVGMTADGAAFHHVVYPGTREELWTDSEELWTDSKTLWIDSSSKLMHDAAQAIRQGRLEWLNYRDHNIIYHPLFDKFMAEIWKFPDTVEKRTVPVILEAAEYIPGLGIRIRNSSAEYVDLSEDTRDRMRRSGIIKPASEEVPFKFLRDFILSQDLSTVAPSSVEELVTTIDITQRHKRGNELLRAAIDRAVDEVRPAYARAYKERLIKPDAPADPVEFILKDPMLFRSAKRQRMARTWLRRTLAHRYDVELVESAHEFERELVNAA